MRLSLSSELALRVWDCWPLNVAWTSYSTDGLSSVKTYRPPAYEYIASVLPVVTSVSWTAAPTIGLLDASSTFP